MEAKDLTTFESENFNVRSIFIDGEPWFVAIDVCSSLSIRNTSKAISRLDSDDYRALTSSDAAGRNNTLNVVNESGLYSLILGSRKPEAKAFKKWLTSEVIPQIRKTGSYQSKSLSPVEQLLANAQILVEQEKRLKLVESENEVDTLTSEQVSHLDGLIHQQYIKNGGKAAGLIKRKIKSTFFEIASTRTYKEIPRKHFQQACDIVNNWEGNYGA